MGISRTSFFLTYAGLSAAFLIASSALAGGMSAGGGNLIHPIPPTDFVPPHIVAGMIVKSQQRLVDYLTAKKVAFTNDQLDQVQRSAWSPIFTSEKDILYFVSTFRPLILERESCHDSNNNDVDGSVWSLTPDTVCISALNISKKAAANDIPPQATALLLHEYSELIGLSDEQAIQAQSAALNELRRSGNDD
jgi:hypothetical protein